MLQVLDIDRRVAQLIVLGSANHSSLDEAFAKKHPQNHLLGAKTSKKETVIYGPLETVDDVVEAYAESQQVRPTWTFLILDDEQFRELLAFDRVYKIGLSVISQQAESSPAAEDAPEGSGPDLSMEIEELGLRTKTFNALIRSGLYTVGGVLARYEEDLLDFRNFGRKGLDELNGRLVANGFPKVRQLRRQPDETLPIKKGVYIEPIRKSEN